MSDRHDFPGAKNLQMKVAGSVLYLYCDLSKDCGLSSSGKTVLISSTSGNKPLGRSGAFLGLNIFTSKLEARNLTADGLGKLHSTGFVEAGMGCRWRIEEDKKTLCVELNFAEGTSRLGSTGKSMLLATSGGIKPIAKTGLSWGLNCYYPCNAAFDASKLSEGASPEDELSVGKSVDLGSDFTATYVAANKMLARYTYRKEDMADGHVASMPALCVGGVTVKASVAAVRAARARTETADESLEARQSASRAGPRGGLQLREGKEEKVRNVEVTCEATDGGDSADSYYVEFAFDPTANLGFSSTGKTIIVASTGGFQHVMDKDGRVVCRLSLNAYRAKVEPTRSDIAAAVKGVLSAKPAAQLKKLIFKNVLEEVMAALGAGEAMKASLRPQVKEEVQAFLKSVA